MLLNLIYFVFGFCLLEYYIYVEREYKLKCISYVFLVKIDINDCREIRDIKVLCVCFFIKRKCLG